MFFLPKQYFFLVGFQFIGVQVQTVDGGHCILRATDLPYC
jgi:hypothetical protein